MGKTRGKTFTIAIDTKDWEGSVDILLMPYVDRIELAQQFQEVSSTDAAKRLMGMAVENVKKLEVKRRDGIESFTSLENLEFYEDGVKLINEIAGFVIKGAPVGNALKALSGEQP